MAAGSGSTGASNLILRNSQANLTFGEYTRNGAHEPTLIIGNNSRQFHFLSSDGLQSNFSVSGAKSGNLVQLLPDSVGSVGIGEDLYSVGNYTVNIDGRNNQSIGVVANAGLNQPGSNFILQAGAANTSGTDTAGGNLVLAAGQAQGAGASSILLQTTGGGPSGTSASAPTTRMTITGLGNVGIGTTSPGRTLDWLNWGSQS